MMFRILLVDQDPAFRKGIAGFLLKDTASWTIEEYSNGLQAISVLRTFKPDLFVCEVEVPGLDGFSLLETVAPIDRPSTIFVSSKEAFAARAFEYSASDYLVKPVLEERFLQALEKAKASVSRVPNWPQKNFSRIAIQNGRSIVFIKPEELDWVEAEGKHVQLHIGKEQLFLKMSISALERELDPVQFVRIHRSTIVNIDRVRVIQPWNHRRTYQLTLHDGTHLVLSRRNKLRALNGKTISNLKEAHVAAHAGP